MQEFNISIGSFRQIRAFVSLAAVQPFDVFVGNDRQQVNGKSFIGMFSLDYTKPIKVRVACSLEAMRSFQQEATKILA